MQTRGMLLHITYFSGFCERPRGSTNAIGSPARTTRDGLPWYKINAHAADELVNKHAIRFWMGLSGSEGRSPSPYQMRFTVATSSSKAEVSFIVEDNRRSVI